MKTITTTTVEEKVELNIDQLETLLIEKYKKQGTEVKIRWDDYSEGGIRGVQIIRTSTNRQEKEVQDD